MTDPILELNDLKVYYQTLKGNVKALDGVTLSINPGEIVGLAGESGCGKTTLGYSLIRLKKPMRYVSGDMKLGGQSLVKKSENELNAIRFKELAMIPQAAMNAFSPTKKIKTFISDLVRQHGITPNGALFNKINERLDIVNLRHEVLNQYPIELSGGMKQRIIMVISTLLDPQLLVADEITSALDVTSQRFVAQLLVDFKNRGIIKAVIFITHDLAILSQIADRIVIMYAGRIAEAAPTDKIIHHPRHPYTRAFLSALPQLGVRFKQKTLQGISGTPPQLLEIGPGCRFRFRCPHAKSLCEEKDPVVEHIDATHSLACHYWKSL